ncbi:spore germination protein GerPC [Virgibacillus sp. C22-A2]|uniref:Spore germination protein GerPC n=1 Tax=Virgibacillus tibetensis TaxID=3042313 RepID=A0ABU6KEY2_9BACI|nr:spore germination protein GerPC [Virgibacillus sp. C22-A2]
MNGNDWTTYMYNLHQYMEKQDKIIKLLETKIEQIEKDLQNKQNNNIEKIEYKFDQLKIEHLDGTLHIGLSPNDLANIDGLGVNQHTQPSYPPPLKQSLVSELGTYLQESGPSLIQDLALQYNTSFDEAYQSILLDDIQKQLPQRIAFYEQESVKTNRNRNAEQLRQYITKEIKNEIYQSLLTYMQTNEQKGEEE